MIKFNGRKLDEGKYLVFLNNNSVDSSNFIYDDYLGVVSSLVEMKDLVKKHVLESNDYYDEGYNLYILDKDEREFIIISCNNNCVKLLENDLDGELNFVLTSIMQADLDKTGYSLKYEKINSDLVIVACPEYCYHVPDYGFTAFPKSNDELRFSLNDYWYCIIDLVNGFMTYFEDVEFIEYLKVCHEYLVNFTQVDCEKCGSKITVSSDFLFYSDVNKAGVMCTKCWHEQSL